MDYLVKIRSVQTPLNGQFSIGANSMSVCGGSWRNGNAVKKMQAFCSGARYLLKPSTGSKNEAIS